MANNLAYYANGDAEAVSQLKLVVNYNQPDKGQAATQRLLEASGILSQQATDQDLSKGIRKALSLGRSKKEVIGHYHHEVRRDNWRNGKGYEVHYLIKFQRKS